MIFAILDSFSNFLVTSENVLMVASILLFLSILAGKAGYKIGLPVLLLFMGVGMLMGSDGLGIKFSNPQTAQFIGVIALSIILFSGGMDTKYSSIRPVLGQGIVLSTLGVLLTALLTGGFIWTLTTLILGGHRAFTFAESMLLASVMASTDSASVFSLLRSRGLHIDKRLRSTLELESGSNDPMAYVLTIICISLIQSRNSDFLSACSQFCVQMSLGGALGFTFGRIAVFIINRINIENTSFYSILLLSLVTFCFSVTDMLDGNGYLAVYVAGLIVGNAKIVHKHSITTFFDGFTWLWQIVLFLTLGLLVDPHQLLDIIWIALAIAAFLILLGRPISVLICLLPFKVRFKEKLYICWVGLKGAVPVIFATYPLIEGIDKAHVIFNIVFFITILSFLLQGSTVAYAAKKLGLIKDVGLDGNEFGVELSENIKSTMSEIVVVPEMLESGSKLMEMKMPENTLVVMVKRGGNFFVPQGNTSLQAGDKLLLISDNAEALERIYKKYNIESYTVEKS